MIEHFEQSGLFLTDEEHSFRLNDYYDCSFLIKLSNQLIGTIKYRELEGKVEIMQFQLHPSFQGKGLGAKIIEQVIDSSINECIELSVLKASPALKLYKRLGFAITDEDDREYFMQITV